MILTEEQLAELERHANAEETKHIVQVTKDELLAMTSEIRAARRRSSSKPCPPGFFCVHEIKCPGAL
jgi:hypothetical protein